MFLDKRELGSFAITSLAYCVNFNKTGKIKTNGNSRGKGGAWN